VIDLPGDLHDAVLAESTRNGVVECRFRGSVVALDCDGLVVFSLGTPEVAVFGRSANKPMQAIAMVRLGLQLPNDLLAFVAASHSGELRHVELGRRLLALGGFDETDLQNTILPPLGVAARDDMCRRGDHPSRLTADCSGKHSAMLWTCKLNGWSTEDYLRTDHPLQSAITETISDYAAEMPEFVGTDGCGAPAHGLSLSGLAMAYARIALEPGGVGQAIRDFPANVGGVGRDVTQLMLALPGLIAKDGADGLLVVSTADGQALAIKMADGSLKPRIPIALDVLERLGVDVSGAAELRSVAVFGGARVVGETRSVIATTR
jgi:L-asparaginase II